MPMAKRSPAAWTHKTCSTILDPGARTKTCVACWRQTVLLSVPSRVEVIAGWLAVGFSLLAACVWACWGTVEGFHEGWHYHSVWRNLALNLAYLIPMTIPMTFALLSLRWPLFGGGLHVLSGAALVTWYVWWIHKRSGTFSFHDLIHIVVFTAVVLIIVGILYMIGRPEPRRLAMGLMVGLPLGLCLVCAIEPAWRVTHRTHDGIRSARIVQGNGVELIWAPAGPGWPDHGNTSFAEAEWIVSLLNEDGLTCAQTPQNIWRLPTVEEVVRSLTRHGQNAGGLWNAAGRKASYSVVPDKESPLWHVASPVIYWWTSSSTPDGNGIYTICYNGQVIFRRAGSMGSLGFRAVKQKHPTTQTSGDPAR